MEGSAQRYRQAADSAASPLTSRVEGKSAVAQINPLLPDATDPQRFSCFTEPEIAFMHTTFGQQRDADTSDAETRPRPVASRAHFPCLPTKPRAAGLP